jgi:hypothetical protein
VAQGVGPEFKPPYHKKIKIIKKKLEEWLLEYTYPYFQDVLERVEKDNTGIM